MDVIKKINDKQDKLNKVKNMKRSGTTTTFTVVCIAVLLASYGIGLGIRQIRFSNAKAQTSGNKVKEATKTLPQRQQKSAARSLEDGQPDATFFGEGRNRGETQDEGIGGRGRYNENMSDEGRSQMRGSRRGRRGMDFENLSDEERAEWQERMRERMERFQNMTDEERAQFRGGRDGRSRGGMSDFGAGENNFGFKANESESSQNDIQSQDDGSGYQENEYQSEDNNSGQEDVDNDIE